MKTRFYALFALVLCFMFVLPAHADIITFALDNTDITGAAGDTITFSAMIATPAGNSGDVYLNGLSITDMSPLTADNTDFLINFPFTLGIDDSAGGDVFTVTLPSVLAPGTYYGTATLLGGADFSAQDNLGSQLFSVTVQAVTNPSPIPEPSSIALIMTGASGVIASLKLRPQRRDVR